MQNLPPAPALKKEVSAGSVLTGAEFSAELERLFLGNYDYETDSAKRRRRILAAVDDCAITDVIGVVKQVLLYVRIQTEELKPVRRAL